MEKISRLSDINYSESPSIAFSATVLQINSEGDGEKKPIKLTLMLETSGEHTIAYSWKFELLDDWKRMVTTTEVGQFTGQASTYGNYGDQIRVGGMTLLGDKSARKIVKTINIDAIKSEIQTIINTYTEKGSIFRKYLQALIMDNEKFWRWPAATKVHHNYPGGLAKHSLNVCKNAIAIWKIYEGSNCNVEMLVTASLLHDIGKLKEYNEDGSRTEYGNMIGHPVIGYEMIAKVAESIGVDPESNMKTVILEHCILSHHGALEYGSPVTPGTLEAWIVHQADDMDAKFEACDKLLDNASLNDSTDRSPAIDGGHLLKWHN